MKKTKIIKKIKRYVELSKKFESKPSDMPLRSCNSILFNGSITSGCASSFTYDSKTKSDEEILDDIKSDLYKEYTDRIELVKDWLEYKKLQSELLELE